MEVNTIRFSSGLALIALLGCGSEQGQPTASVPSDSAGIRIIASTATPPQLAARPIVSIGTLAGDVAYTFNHIAGIEIGADTSIYVLDGADNMVKVYNSTGLHLYSFGRKGEGPEEFLDPATLISWPDTIAVFDWRLQKIAKFDPITGALLGTERVPYSLALAGFPRFVERMAPGQYLIVSMIGCQLPRTTSTSSWRVFLAQAEIGITDTLANRSRGNDIPFYGEADSFCAAPPFPFGASPVLVADATRVAVASGERGEVWIYHEPRALQRPDEIWRYEPTRSPVAAEDQTRYENQFADADAEFQDALFKALEERGYPLEWPSITALLMDDEGRVWALRGAPEGAEYRTWDILDPERGHVAVVRFPSGVRLQAIGAGYGAATRRDELDVQYVELFRIPDLAGHSP